MYKSVLFYLILHLSNLDLLFSLKILTGCLLDKRKIVEGDEARGRGEGEEKRMKNLTASRLLPLHQRDSFKNMAK